MPQIIHVAAGALINAQGQVLIARRHADAHQGGLWEFPGGKCEPGESIDDALKRELSEELGVDVLAHRPLIRVTHHYADRSVLLDVHRVDQWDGEPHGKEGQPLEWVAPEALNDFPMPAADVPIVRALQLPDCYLITPPQIHDSEQFLRQLDSALQQGVRLVQFRVFDLSVEQQSELARQAQALCAKHQAQLLINGALEIRGDMGPVGLHLSSRQLSQVTERPACAGLLAASCHNAHDLQHAQSIGADFAVLSPVLPTRSHPDADPLGWDRFSQLVDEAALPVYALGGMHPGLAETACCHGAQGLAGIRGLWPSTLG